jgi:hypothetical protein
MYPKNPSNLQGVQGVALHDAQLTYLARLFANSSSMSPIIAILLAMYIALYYSVSIAITDLMQIQIGGLRLINSSTFDTGFNITGAFAKSDDIRASYAESLFLDLESINDSIRSIDIVLNAGDLNITLDLGIIEQAVLDIALNIDNSKPQVSHLFTDISHISETLDGVSTDLFVLKETEEDASKKLDSINNSINISSTVASTESNLTNSLLSTISVHESEVSVLLSDTFSDSGWASQLISTTRQISANLTDLSSTIKDHQQKTLDSIHTTLDSILKELQGDAFKKKVAECIRELSYTIKIPETSDNLDIHISEAKAVEVTLDLCVQDELTFTCTGSKFVDFRNPTLGYARLTNLEADHVQLIPHM